MNKNTLYITFDGLSDPLGQSQILPYLCGIAAKGYNITILSCEKKERLQKEEHKIQTLIKDLPIHWQYILYDEDGGFLSRFLYIRRLGKLAKNICREKKISLVHCRSYLASLVGLSLKTKHAIPFVFDMRGFWADERIDGGIWKKTNPLQAIFYTYFKRKEKQYIEQSDAVISLTNAGVKELSKNFPGTDLTVKTTVIPCCTNTSVFDKARVPADFSISEISAQDHVLIYTGSVGTWYYTKEIIDCVSAWKKHIPEIKLLILTKDNNELNKILDSCSPEQRRLVISKSASYSEVANYLSLAKAAIFFIKPAYSKIASSPTKMAECWAMNLPIVTNSGIGDNDLYFNKHSGGILIDHFSASDYDAACLRYLDILKSTTSYRNIALNYFDTRMAIERYLAVYDKLSI